MSNPEKYECTLDKASLQKAAKELHEDPAERESAVASLRQWIEQNSSWLKTPTDTKFLLSFLRSGKFAQLAARKRLVNYWTARTDNPKWFSKVDTLDPKVSQILNFGNMLPLPMRDTEGRGLIFTKVGNIDILGQYSVDEVMKASMAIVDYILMDENIQVNGVSFVQDLSGFTLKHQTFFSLDTIKRSMNVWIKGYPLRYKQVHYINSNPMFDAMFAIMAPLMPEKLKKRLHFHGPNVCNVYNFIDKSLIPKDYLPEDFKGCKIGTFRDCIERNVKAMQEPEVREHLLRLSSDEYKVIKSLKPSDDGLFAESFRKLNVD